MLAGAARPGASSERHKHGEAPAGRRRPPARYDGQRSNARRAAAATAMTASPGVRVGVSRTYAREERPVQLWCENGRPSQRQEHLREQRCGGHAGDAASSAGRCRTREIVPQPSGRAANSSRNPTATLAAA